MKISEILRYLFIGIMFGFILVKSEVISWFRIQEMFLFESFHMYGIIGAAVILVILFVQLAKKKTMKPLQKYWHQLVITT